jgi:hypothetical protein
MRELGVAALWITVACVWGFAISAIFSAWLEFRRRLFLIPYIALTSAFLFTFAYSHGVDPTALIEQNFVWGATVGLIAGGLLIQNVRSQPFSRESTGGELILDLLWSGLTYGIIDALYLNIMPVLVLQAGLSRLGWGSSGQGRIAIGLSAFLASMLVTLVYHLGYKEFRNRRVGKALLGNAIITLAFLVSGNPLAAILAHTVMHIAAVIQGPETTIQLPPHNQQPI